MSSVRCSHCGYLCAPFLFHCAPCWAEQGMAVHYCGEMCKNRDAEHHSRKFHPAAPEEGGEGQEAGPPQVAQAPLLPPIHAPVPVPVPVPAMAGAGPPPLRLSVAHSPPQHQQHQHQPQQQHQHQPQQQPQQQQPPALAGIPPPPFYSLAVPHPMGPGFLHPSPPGIAMVPLQQLPFMAHNGAPLAVLGHPPPPPHASGPAGPHQEMPLQAGMATINPVFQQQHGLQQQQQQQPLSQDQLQPQPQPVFLPAQIQISPTPPLPPPPRLPGDFEPSSVPSPSPSSPAVPHPHSDDPSVVSPSSSESTTSLAPTGSSSPASSVAPPPTNPPSPPSAVPPPVNLLPSPTELFERKQQGEVVNDKPPLEEEVRKVGGGAIPKVKRPAAAPEEADARLPPAESESHPASEEADARLPPAVSEARPSSEEADARPPPEAGPASPAAPRVPEAIMNNNSIVMGESMTPLCEETKEAPECVSGDKKLSKLEQKREARKAKKAVRRREKLQRLGKAGSDGADSGRAQSPEAEKKRKEEPEKATQDTKDGQAANNVAPLVEAESPSPAACTDDADSLAWRSLTKKEKKREERRLLNARKKKEKQAKREAEVRAQKTQLEMLRDDAQSLFAEGQFIKSAIAYRQAQKEAPEDATLFAGSRDCYLALGKVHQALNDAKRAVELAAEGSAREHQLTKLLHLHLMSGQASEALATCGRFPHAKADLAAKEKQRVMDMKLKRAQVHCELDAERHDAAAALLQDLERVCPHCPQFQLLKAESLFHQPTKSSEAQQLLRKNVVLLRKEPLYPFVLALERYFTSDWWVSDEREGDLMRRLQDCTCLAPRCVALYKRAMQIKSEYRLSTLLMKNGAKAKARKTLSGCTQLHPLHFPFLADVHHQLALCQETNEETLRHYDLALSFDEEAKKSLLERGKLLLSMRKFESAIADFDRVLKKEPHCEHARRLLNQARRVQENLHRVQCRKVNLYLELGVSVSATHEEIVQAYKIKSKEHRAGMRSHDAEEREYHKGRLKLVTKAFKVLSNARTRNNYDRQLKRNSSSDVDSEFSEEEFDLLEACDSDELDVHLTGDDDEEEAAGAASAGGDGAAGAAAVMGKVVKARHDGPLAAAAATGGAFDEDSVRAFENTEVFNLFQSFMEPKLVDGSGDDWLEGHDAGAAGKSSPAGGRTRCGHRAQSEEEDED